MLAAVLVFVPVLGAFLAHAPVLRFDLFRALARPLDGGRTWRGRRLLGDNKTWRGVVAMWTGVVVATVALARVPAWWDRLPAPLRAAGAVRYGALLGLGTIVAELPNSFVKRRLDVAPGAQRASPLGVVLAIVDQGDFVLGAWAALAPIWTMSVGQAVVAFVVVAVVHAAVNVVGRAIGARRTWL